jgi:hypothetical protein
MNPKTASNESAAKKETRHCRKAIDKKRETYSHGTGTLGEA